MVKGLQLCGQIKRLKRRIGQRGILLVVFASTFTAYGIGLILGYHPTFLRALGLPDPFFGAMFVTTGVIQSIGALLRWGRFPYCVGVFMASFWTCTLFIFWEGQYGWTACISWAAIAAVNLLAAIWPEPVHIVTSPVPEKRARRA